jgi:inosose dehydratase
MRPQVAFNPITWRFTPDGVLLDPAAAPPLAEVYRHVREAGYDAVHADVPAGTSVADYRALLDDSGLAPAPGYFQAPFAQSDELGDIRERAVRIAGQHAELGLDRIFIAEQFGVAPERIASPATGAGFDQGRLDRIIDNLGTVATAMTAEGVTPCLHQHVGSLIETPGELEAVLAGVDPSVLLLGPDTGHLFWAGADPAEVIDRHRDRIGAVHLKDVRRARVEQAGAEHRDYWGTMPLHIWTEPERGDVDFDAVLAALSRFDGWYVIEVDVPDQPSARGTAEVSAAWVRERLQVPA